MRQLSKIAAAFAALGLATAAPGLALAHHSATMYDRTKAITTEAVVKNLRWFNPHVYLTITTVPKPGMPPQDWTVEMSSPGVLTRAGWTKRTFNPGDRITVQFAPMRNGSPAGLYMSATTVEGKTMTWSFKPSEQANLN